MGGKATENRKEMKANSHSQGCGSLFACLAVSAGNKHKQKSETKASGQEVVAAASSECVVSFALVLFIFQEAFGDREDFPYVSLPATPLDRPAPFPLLPLLSSLSRGTTGVRC